MKLLLVFLFVTYSVTVAQDLSSFGSEHPEAVFKPRYQEYKIEGSVILYAKSWLGFQSANQEFVFKTDSQTMPLIRVIYLPACCFDAPPVSPQNIFDDRQFAIVGSLWRLTVHTPYWDWDKDACRSIQMTVSFVDEKGTIVREEPRFRPVSGREKESIPLLSTLPCLVLKERGWQRLPTVKGAATSR